MQALVQLALVTGARVGELLALRWDACDEGSLTFLETKNGEMRRVPRTPAIDAILERLPRVHPYVFVNPATGKPYTASGVRYIYRRALVRAGITGEQTSPHVMRHTALSRMIGAGHSDHTVKAISGHKSTPMLERYVHPTQELKVAALESGTFVVTIRSQSAGEQGLSRRERAELNELLRKSGGRREDRTRDLRVANAALSQLS